MFQKRDLYWEHDARDVHIQLLQQHEIYAPHHAEKVLLLLFDSYQGEFRHDGLKS